MDAAEARRLVQSLFHDGKHHVHLWRTGTIWIYDSDRHPQCASETVKHRMCVDLFTHTLTWILLWVSCILEGAFSWFSLGAIPFLYPLSIITAIMAALIMLIGEWAVRRGIPLLSYAYLASLYWLWVLRMWCAGMSFIYIAKGQEFFEEKWPIVQVAVPIPFTTQMDMKVYVSFFVKTIFYMALITTAFSAGSLDVIWKSLGGATRLVQSRLGILLIEVVPLFVIASLTIYYDNEALQISSWASDVSNVAVAWQSGMAGLTLVSGCAVLAASAMWESNFLVHAFLAAVFGPLSLASMATAISAYMHASSVPGFVTTNWDLVQLFVPPDYTLQQSDKYMLASQTPMLAASLSGFMMATLLFFGMCMHASCASLLLRVGPELAEIRRRQVIAHNNLVMTTWKSPKGLIGSPAAAAAGGKAPPSVKTPLIPQRFSESSSLSAAASPAPVASNPFSRSAAVAAASAPTNLMQAAAQYQQEQQQAEGGSSSSAAGDPFSGAASGGPSGEDLQGASDPLGNGGDGYGSTAGGGAAAGSAPYYRSGGGSFSGRSEDGLLPAPSRWGQQTVDATSLRVRLIPNGPGGGGPVTPGGSDPRDPYSAVARSLQSRMKVPKTPFMHDREEIAAVERASASGATAGMKSLARKQFTALWAVHSTCFAASMMLAVFAVVGMGSGLGVVVSQTKCGVLVRNPPSVTFVRSFPVYVPVTMPSVGTITVTHNWPYGAVEIVATEQNSNNDNFTVEVTSWATSPDQLLSYESFNASIQLGTFHNPHDDDLGGYEDVRIVFNDPGWGPGACVGLRILITSQYPASYVVSTGAALVNITGDLVEVVEKAQFTRWTFFGLTVTTDSGSVGLTDIHVEPTSLVTATSASPCTLNVSSRTGDIFLTRVLAAGPVVSTGGDIRSENVISSAPLMGCSTSSGGTVTPAMCGDIRYTTRGSGTMGITKSLGANNLYVTSESGAIVFATAALIIPRDVWITSTGGAPIYLSTYLQAAGNNTYVQTSGSVSATAVLANRLFVTLFDTGSFSMYVGFLGLGNPGALAFPQVPGYYAPPVLKVTTDRGNIAGIIVSSLSNATALSFDLQSNLGSIKLEISSDGFFGNYSALAPRGSSLVEITGDQVASVGTLGNPGQGTGYCNMMTSGGDVQLSILASLV